MCLIVYVTLRANIFSHLIVLFIKVSGIPNSNKLIKRYNILTCEDMIPSHVKILMISLLSSLSLKFCLNLLVYRRNIFGSSSKVFGNLQKSLDIFGNFRKMFGNVRLAFRTILENHRKSSEIGWKSLENHQKSHHHQLLYNEKNITR